eukprot:TRINITY_DN9023_c0_g1_i3.p2 TRINITY_DN9023_c0_g1~~TRINITY_DN9023_c0_g1_i3.p2  ORF type:complete len:143 (-),score=16.52 TRINITY_DN9023_c0_g1_i3:23-451(-)
MFLILYYLYLKLVSADQRVGGYYFFVQRVGDDWDLWQVRNVEVGNTLVSFDWYWKDQDIYIAGGDDYLWCLLEGSFPLFILVMKQSNSDKMGIEGMWKISYTTCKIISKACHSKGQFFQPRKKRVGINVQKKKGVKREIQLP